GVRTERANRDATASARCRMRGLDSGVAGANDDHVELRQTNSLATRPVELSLRELRIASPVIFRYRTARRYAPADRRSCDARQFLRTTVAPTAGPTTRTPLAPDRAPTCGRRPNAFARDRGGRYAAH